MVLKVRSLAVEVEVEAVGGASVEAANEVAVGMLSGVELDVGRVREGRVVFPMDFIICADFVGRISASCRVKGGNSASRTDWKEMYTRSR